jgi:hypothetical protein
MLAEAISPALIDRSSIVLFMIEGMSLPFDFQHTRPSSYRLTDHSDSIQEQHPDWATRLNRQKIGGALWGTVGDWG